MPFYAAGNLEDLNREDVITVNETRCILLQALEAISFLHFRHVAHRDLKPANILIESWRPLHIRIADFGLANDRSDLKTVCGTVIYAAPKIHLGKPYMTSVDIWSPGVIVLQFLRGLPTEKSEESWCDLNLRHATKCQSKSPDPVLAFVLAGMLSLEATSRWDAEQCLHIGRQRGVFTETTDGNDITPIRPGQDGKGTSRTVRKASKHGMSSPVRTTEPFSSSPPQISIARRQRSPTEDHSQNFVAQGKSKRRQADISHISSFTREWNECALPENTIARVDNHSHGNGKSTPTRSHQHQDENGLSNYRINSPGRSGVT